MTRWSRRTTTAAALFAAAVLAAACSGSAASDAPNQALYLTLVRNPATGTLAQRDDATLVALGERACADMDRGLPSDQVVADLGGDPLPGSADFNAYSVVTAAAARALCPAHKSDFANLPGALTDS
jgi:hypothetical protein